MAVIDFTKSRERLGQKVRPVLDQKEPRIMWICGICGCQWFWLYKGGDVQCTQCDTMQAHRTFNPEDKP